MCVGLNLPEVMHVTVPDRMPDRYSGWHESEAIRAEPFRRGGEVTRRHVVPDPAEFVVADSITNLPFAPDGRVVVCGSHGGHYVAAVADGHNIRALVVNDAGIGRDRAGVAGLENLAVRGVPAVAVGHDTARIGDGTDTLERGVLSVVNEPARLLGCCPGMTCTDAVGLLIGAGLERLGPPLAAVREARRLVVEGPVAVWELDSASLARSSDAGAVLITGSHGGLLGGDPSRVLKADAAAAVFSDAGIGIDGAGYSRLAVLEERGIAAVTVSAESARIGDAGSVHTDGIVSTVNRSAERLGAVARMRAADFIEFVCAIRAENTQQEDVWK